MHGEWAMKEGPDFAFKGDPMADLCLAVLSYGLSILGAFLGNVVRNRGIWVSGGGASFQSWDPQTRRRAMKGREAMARRRSL